jgi:hypothetical protein
MRHTILRWALFFVSALVLGPLAGSMTASLRAADGGRHASLLVNDSMVMGVLVGLGVFALALVAGVGAARVAGVRHGFLCAGLTLAWAAWGTGQVDRILHRTLSASTMYTLSAEGLLVGALSVGLGAVIILLAQQPKPDPSLAPPTSHHHAAETRTLFDKATPMALGASLLAGAIIAWLVAQDTLKGQTFAAAAFAGMFGATAGRLAAPTSSSLTFIAAIALLGIASPAIATFMHPAAMGPTRAALAGTLFPLARPLPLDWAAGAFVGIPLGLSWATSLVEKHGHAHTPPV